MLSFEVEMVVICTPEFCVPKLGTVPKFPELGTNIGTIFLKYDDYQAKFLVREFGTFEHWKAFRDFYGGDKKNWL